MYKDIIESLLLRIENRLKINVYGVYLTGIEDTFKAIYEEIEKEKGLNA
jgi:hypothetical protein